MANEILWNGEDVLEGLRAAWGVEGQISGLVDVETLDGIFEDLRAAWHVEDQPSCPITSSKGRGGRSPVSRQITGE